MLCHMDATIKGVHMLPLVLCMQLLCGMVASALTYIRTCICASILLMRHVRLPACLLCVSLCLRSVSVVASSLLLRLYRPPKQLRVLQERSSMQS
jgi:hypothetical protein